jgi:hypothetical protein
MHGARAIEHAHNNGTVWGEHKQVGDEVISLPATVKSVLLPIVARLLQ